jgi:hypothetical protein
MTKYDDRCPTVTKYDFNPTFLYYLHLTHRMKLLSFFLFLAFPSVAQTDEIYRLTFSDTTNFSIMNSFSYARPKNIVILDTTVAWDYTVFWNKFVGGETQEQIYRETMTSRHESYDPEYLFRDSLMIKAISVAERKALRKKTLTFEPKRLSLRGPNYRTIPSAKNIKGFYVATAVPVFSTDGRYAFVDLEILLHEDDPNSDDWGDAFGSVAIVYQKQSGGRWKKFKLVNRLIL